MRDEQNSGRHKLATWLAHAMVHAWPAESRHWGLALEAELIEIENAGAAMRWTLGGVMLLTRAWWNQFMRSWMRPAGVPESGPLAILAKNASRVPRTPRFVTALLLLGSMAFLLVPDVRDAMQASFRAWREEMPDAANSPAFTRLSHAAGTNHDPQAMALMALVSNDREERMRMANEAVRLDPSLTWIYSEVSTDEGPVPYMPPQTIPAEWLEKLRKWDPDNAVPQLLTAQQALVHFNNESRSGGYGYFNDQKTLDKLVKDSTWLPSMDLAFRAPKYDSYYSLRFDLYRSVMLRYGFRDSEIAASLMNRFPLFVQYEEKLYGEFLLARGQKAEQAGKFEDAVQLYWQPARIGERMAEQSHTNFDRAGWVEMQNASLRKLQPLLVRMGRAEEAAQVGYRIEALQTNLFPDGPVKTWAWNENGWEGFAIRTLTGGIYFLGGGFLIGFGALFLRRRMAIESRGRGLALASIAVDFCPLLLVLACAGLFVAYRPIALMYDQYMNWPLPVYDFRGLIHALRTPYESPDGVWGIFYDYLNPVHYWMAAIVGLSMIAFYIMVRGTLRRRETVS